jgi:CubicO group peptidase (beta-lactamase class C family)
VSDPQSVLDRAVAAGDLPFAVALVGGPDGPLWEGAAGPAQPGVPAGQETVFRLFSMTKAVGAVAAAIFVDRGGFGLDDPVGAALPAFDALPVLDGWDGATPRLRPQRTRATLRHLLSHTSGAAYDVWHPEIDRFNRLENRPSPRTGLRGGLDVPLAFDPGTGWAYGTGLDWAGLLIEAVDGRRIDVFCDEEIFGPLGMAETVFEVPAPLMPRLAAVRQRAADGFAIVDAPPVSRPQFWGMGHALVGTGRDYLRFLRMLLNRGAFDGRRILSEPMVVELFANQIDARRLGPMPSFRPGSSAAVTRLGGVPTTQSLFAVRNEAAIPGRRAAGAQGWAGLLNTHFWLDPARGRGGMLLTQCRPFWDPRIVGVLEAFERSVHDL